MRNLGAILLGSVAGLALIGGAQAADLPTKKAPPAPPATSCFASFGLDECDRNRLPAERCGFTVYGTIDLGVGYESHGVDFNRQYPTGVEELISKNSQGGKWALTPGGLSQSNVGIKMSEPLVRRAGSSSATRNTGLIPIPCSSPTVRARWAQNNPAPAQPAERQRRLEPRRSMGQLARAISASATRPSAL